MKYCGKQNDRVSTEESYFMRVNFVSCSLVGINATLPLAPMITGSSVVSK